MEYSGGPKEIRKKTMEWCSKCSLASDNPYCHAIMRRKKCNISDGFLDIFKFQKHPSAEYDSWKMVGSENDTLLMKIVNAF